MAGTLHLVCGKIAAGKSTLCARLAEPPGTILVSQDFWMKRLWGDELREVADYLRVAPKLNGAMGPLVTDLLAAGLDVVLDFPANTLVGRAWMRTVFEEAGAAHQLHYLDVPDETCKARLRERNAAGTHDFTVSDEIFDLFTSHFVPPTPDEGFNLVVHRP